MPPPEAEARQLLLRLFEAGLTRVKAEICLPAHLPKDPPKGRTVVLGAGKAAAAMAEALVDAAPWPVTGLVATRHGHGVGRTIPGIEVIEAGHPVPDAASAVAARRMLEMAAMLGPDDRLIFLASGGGSATAALPAAGLTLAQKQALVRHLVRSGAAVGEINCVRKHISAIKGGRLAAAASRAGEILSYAISDVAGDDPSAIASGPTVADPTTLADARTVIERYGAPDQAAVMRVLDDPANETPKELPPACRTTLIATARDFLDAAAGAARKAGLEVIDLGDRVEGEAREVAGAHAARVRALLPRVRAEGRPAVILSGGELTVTLGDAAGRGGPNLEYLGHLARALEGAPNVHALSCDTDGIDGSEDAAGGVIGPGTLARARSAGIDPDRCLARHDSHALLQAAGGLVVTGPTLTNVNDFRAILVTPERAG